jgi:predicted Na+-dependent transporter
MPCVLGLVAALLIARSIDLKKPSAVAVAIECCYQNTGLALTIALSAVPASEVGKASGVPIFYGLVEIALIP